MVCLKALLPEKWHAATVLAPRMHRLYFWVNFRPNKTPWVFVRRVQKTYRLKNLTLLGVVECFEWSYSSKKIAGFAVFGWEWGCLGNLVCNVTVMFGMKTASQRSCVAEVSSKVLRFPSFCSHAYYHQAWICVESIHYRCFVGWYTVSASFFQVRPDWSPKWRSFCPLKGSLKTPKFGSTRKNLIEDYSYPSHPLTIGMIMKLLSSKGHDSGMP